MFSVFDLNTYLVNFLSLKDILNLTVVNKNFNKVFEDERCWKVFVSNNIEESQKFKVLHTNKKKLINIYEKLEKFKVLHTNKNTIIADYKIKKIINIHKKLENKITQDKIPVEHKKEFSDTFESLEKVIKDYNLISNDKKYYDLCFRNIFSFLLEIKDINLKSVNSISIENFRTDIFEHISSRNNGCNKILRLLN